MTKYKPCGDCGKPFPAYNKTASRCATCKREDYRKRSAQKRADGGDVSRFTRDRFLILRRDKFKCAYCGLSSLEDGVGLHVDHAVPRSHGGPDIASNLITACERCNLSKTNGELDVETLDRVLAEIGKRNEVNGISPYQEIKMASGA